ncbi:alpha/beta hydrolase-fold protein [Flavobacterium sp.]|uniref:alpha/beta hydrolase-fold protein n=1 Tax=Flavobacterium sp. TaxID=239 RepID=UPI002621D8F4|nr:alpha/beta hydrolase-fold protein [Flavobacterium sp.]
MKKIVFFLYVFCTLNAYSQKITEEVFSPKLNEKREITIGLPPSYLTSPNKKYPILIVLDGDYLFDPFQGALNYGAYWDDLPEVIIVGVNQNKNNERETDCTIDQTTGLPDEKGNQFFEFIGMELMGYMEKKYRLAPFKIIAGHDITAGFLNFYLYKEKPLFDAYISMSPELPTAMEKNIPDRFNALDQPIYYYQSTADGDVKKMQSRIRELDAELKKITKPSINYKFDEFKGASHYSLVLHSIPNALYQFFSVYQPISTTEFIEKISVLPSGYVDYLINKYSTLEKSLNIKMPIRINDFKAIEAAILKNKAYAEFDKLADLAKKNYPKTMLADYEMAMMYEKTGDLKKAVKAYQSAFQKEEIGDLTKDMMLDKADELKNQ